MPPHRKLCFQNPKRPEEIQKMEDSQTPPSMILQARHQVDASSKEDSIVHNSTTSLTTYLSNTVSKLLCSLDPLARTVKLLDELKDQLMCLFELPFDEHRDLAVLCCIPEYFQEVRASTTTHVKLRVLIKFLTKRRFLDGQTKMYSPYVINAGQLTPSVEDFVLDPGKRLWRVF